MKTPLRILQLVGSPTSTFYRDLSELYASGSIDALADPARYEFVIAHVSPDGSWRFPRSLAADAIASASPLSFAEAANGISQLRIDAAIPQMFCHAGMTAMRALLDLLAIPYLGNRPLQMAISANKTMAKAIVAAAGVDVPRSEVLRIGQVPPMGVPAVVKPSDADNSDGVSLVLAQSDFAAALELAATYSPSIIVEEYVPLGREVRCGIVERRGELVCLPLEEYFVDTRVRPIRRQADKIGRAAGGGLALMAKTKEESWIVPAGDPIVPGVWAAARSCYTALDCRQYGLFDFRIDPSGRPWFLEAGLYCSFAPKSVIVTMMAASGTSLPAYFAEALEDLLAAGAADTEKSGAQSTRSTSNSR